jgi:HEAT repeat protein
MMQFRNCAHEKYKAYFLKWLGDAEPAARQYAAEALFRLKLSGDVPEPLKKALGDKDFLVRRWAASAVAATGSPDVPGLLIGLLQDKSYSVRAAAARGLGSGPVEKVRDALLKALGDKSKHVIAAAVASLGMLKCTQAAGEVASLLDSQDFHVKRAAVEALVRIGLRKYADRLVEIGSDSKYTWLVIRAVKESGAPLAYSVVERILAKLDETPGLDNNRVRVLEAMLGLDEKKTRGRVLKLFRDPKILSRYKYWLIRILRKCPDKQVIEALIEQLDSQDPSLQAQSLEALRYLTARELDAVGFRNRASDQQRKALKGQWQEWWSKNKESFSLEKAASARRKTVDSLLSQARELMSKEKYREALNRALAVRRLEPGRKETEAIVRKASFLQSIERDVKLQRSRNK